MAKAGESMAARVLGTVGDYIRKCLFKILSVGPIPSHIAFIMDGNRRYSKKQSLEEGAGHKAGYSALMAMLSYCFELDVKYVTIYAFSIENFKRPPEEVQTLMDLMLEKIEELAKREGIVNQYGIRVYFIGNLKLLSEPVRAAAEKVMKSSANNTKAVLLICVAYTSRDEIVHAVQESCKSKREDLREDGYCNGVSGVPIKRVENSSIIRLEDVEKHMYMAVAPDPDIVIRSSGETRLSNFLLWQTANCPLYSPTALWPEIGLQHLVWSVLNFQRHHCHIENGKKKKKQL